MFDIGWTELLIIGIVALIVVGPKDLPGLFRNLGRFVSKARGMAREFQRAMESAADESGVNDVARDFKNAASGKDLGLDEIKDMTSGAKNWKSHVRKGLTGTDDDAGDTEPAPEGADEAPAKKPGRGPATEALARKREQESAARSEGEATAGESDASGGAEGGGAEAPGSGKATGSTKTAGSTKAKSGAAKAKSGGSGATKSAGTKTKSGGSGSTKTKSGGASTTAGKSGGTKAAQSSGTAKSTSAGKKASEKGGAKTKTSSGGAAAKSGSGRGKTSGTGDA